MIVAVLYDPTAEKRRPGLPFGSKGDREFFYPIIQPGRKKGEEAIQLKPLCLKSGANFVDSEVWEKITAVDVNLADINQLAKDRVLTIYQSEGVANDITAFADEDAVTHIIENTGDRDRLDLWLRVESRTGDDGGLDVRRLISDRIRELDEIAKERTSSASGQLF